MQEKFDDRRQQREAMRQKEREEAEEKRRQEEEEERRQMKEEEERLKEEEELSRTMWGEAEGGDDTGPVPAPTRDQNEDKFYRREGLPCPSLGLVAVSAHRP